MGWDWVNASFVQPNLTATYTVDPGMKVYFYKLYGSVQAIIAMKYPGQPILRPGGGYDFSNLNPGDGGATFLSFLLDDVGQAGGGDDIDFVSFLCNPYGIKETEEEEYRTRYTNPLGVLTAKHFSDKITGSGTIDIVHDELSNEINVMYDAELGIGSISLGDGGFTISVGIQNNIEIGLNQNGIMVGYSSRRNGIVSGTEYSWRPSPLWYFIATVPIQITHPTFVY